MCSQFARRVSKRSVIWNLFQKHSFVCWPTLPSKNFSSLHSLCMKFPNLKFWVQKNTFTTNKSLKFCFVQRFRPVLSQTHISKRELKNGHISRFCSVFQVSQVISSAKFFSAEEVDLSFNSETKQHPQILNASFWKRDCENVFLQMF